MLRFINPIVRPLACLLVVLQGLLLPLSSMAEPLIPKDMGDRLVAIDVLLNQPATGAYFRGRLSTEQREQLVAEANGILLRVSLEQTQARQKLRGAIGTGFFRGTTLLAFVAAIFFTGSLQGTATDLYVKSSDYTKEFSDYSQAHKEYLDQNEAWDNYENEQSNWESGRSLRSLAYRHGYIVTRKWSKPHFERPDPESKPIPPSVENSDSNYAQAARTMAFVQRGIFVSGSAFSIYWAYLYLRKFFQKQSEKTDLKPFFQNLEPLRNANVIEKGASEEKTIELLVAHFNSLLTAKSRARVAAVVESVEDVARAKACGEALGEEEAMAIAEVDGPAAAQRAR